MKRNPADVKLTVKSFFITLAIILPVFFSVYFFAVLLPILRETKQSAAEGPSVPLATNNYNLLLGVCGEDDLPLCACLLRFDAGDNALYICSIPRDYLAQTLFCGKTVTPSSCAGAANALSEAGGTIIDGWCFFDTAAFAKAAEQPGPFIYTVTVPVTVTDPADGTVFRLLPGSAVVGGELCANMVKYCAQLPQQSYCNFIEQLAVSAFTQYAAQNNISFLSAYRKTAEDACSSINASEAATIERTMQSLFANSCTVAGISVNGTFLQDQSFEAAYPVLDERFAA